MVDIQNVSGEARQIILWIVAALIAMFWGMMTSAFALFAPSGSVEIHSNAALVRYMSAVGVIAVHYLAWRFSRLELIPSPVDSRTGLIICVWLLVIIHALFTATGPIQLPPWELPSNPYVLIHFVTVPMVYFSAIALREKEGR